MNSPNVRMSDEANVDLWNVDMQGFDKPKQNNK